MSELLSQLYTSMGHYREAMGVHENVLRLVVDGDDGDDRTVDTMESQRVKMHVEWLKQSYLRLKGWDKSAATYQDLVNAILHMKEYRHQPEWQGVRGTDHWDKKEPASDSIGRFVLPKQWEFEDPETATPSDGAKENERSGMAMRRATSNWGLNYFRHILNGDHESDHRNGNGTMTEIPEAAKPFILDGDDDGYESAEEEMGEYPQNGDGVNGKPEMFSRGVDGVCA